MRRTFSIVYLDTTMILSENETHIVSSFPNVDGGSIFAYNVETGNKRTIELSKATSLILHPGTNDLFAATHHYGGQRIEISIHNVTEPEKQLARLEIHGQIWRFEGDDEAWQHLPTVFVVFFTREINVDPDYHLLTIQPGGRAIDLQKIDWYDREHMDLNGGIRNVIKVPGNSEELIYEIVRDAKPIVVYDTFKKRISKRLGLPMTPPAERDLAFRRGTTELWVTNFDMLYRFEPGRWLGWKEKDSLQLQPSSGESQFVGQMWFNHAETFCVVARPFRGDVVVIDMPSFKVTRRALLGNQPRAAVVLKDERVFARDWNTGELLQGSLAPGNYYL